MTDSNERKITRFDILRIEKNAQKLCRCYDAPMILDRANRFVYCKGCGGIIDPYEALERVARSNERYSELWDLFEKEKKELDEYKPFLRVIRDIEKKYRGRKFPMCPVCREPFDFKDIKFWCCQSDYEIRKHGKECYDGEQGK